MGALPVNTIGCGGGLPSSMRRTDAPLSAAALMRRRRYGNQLVDLPA